MSTTPSSPPAARTPSPAGRRRSPLRGSATTLALLSGGHVGNESGATGGAPAGMVTPETRKASPPNSTKMRPRSVERALVMQGTTKGGSGGGGGGGGAVMRQHASWAAGPAFSRKKLLPSVAVTSTRSAADGDAPRTVASPVASSPAGTPTRCSTHKKQPSEERSVHRLGGRPSGANSPNSQASEGASSSPTSPTPAFVTDESMRPLASPLASPRGSDGRGVRVSFEAESFPFPTVEDGRASSLASRATLALQRADTSPLPDSPGLAGNTPRGRRRKNARPHVVPNLSFRYKKPWFVVRLPQALMVHKRNRQRLNMGRPGDWLVVDPQGGFRTFRPREFHEHFGLLPGTTRIAHYKTPVTAIKLHRGRRGKNMRDADLRRDSNNASVTSNTHRRSASATSSVTSITNTGSLDMEGEDSFLRESMDLEGRFVRSSSIFSEYSFSAPDLDAISASRSRSGSRVSTAAGDQGGEGDDKLQQDEEDVPESEQTGATTRHRSDRWVVTDHAGIKTKWSDEAFHETFEAVGVADLNPEPTPLPPATRADSAPECKTPEKAATDSPGPPPPVPHSTPATSTESMANVQRGSKQRGHNHSSLSRDALEASSLSLKAASLNVNCVPTTPGNGGKNDSDDGSTGYVTPKLTPVQPSVEELAAAPSPSIRRDTSHIFARFDLMRAERCRRRTPILAFQLARRAVTSRIVLTSHGGCRFEAGQSDWVIHVHGRGTHTMTDVEFQQTYAPIAGQPHRFREKQVWYSQRMEEPFHIVCSGTPVAGAAGQYVLRGEYGQQAVCSESEYLEDFETVAGDRIPKAMAGVTLPASNHQGNTPTAAGRARAGSRARGGSTAATPYRKVSSRVLDPTMRADV